MCCLSTWAGWTATADEQMHWFPCEVSLPQGAERWVVVRTTVGEQRAQATLQRQVGREQHTWEKRLWHLQARRFACEADAQAALRETVKKLPHWFELQCTCTVHVHHAGKGRPSQGTTPSKQGRQCHATLLLRKDVVAAEGRRRACFIVGTNILDATHLSDWELVKSYQQQGSAERGLRVLKAP